MAETLLSFNMLEEAKAEFKELIELSGRTEAKLGLAKVYYALEEYAPCNVLLEELLDTQPNSIDFLVLHAKALLANDEVQDAIGIYEHILSIDPHFTDDDLDQLRTSVSDTPTASDPELPFIEQPDVNFADVGGMDKVKQEVEMKIIKPLEYPDLYKAYGKKVGGGILLYGPPGCGKTFLAKATAGQVKAKFISIGLNDILDMWMGNSEKNLHGMFEVARSHTPCVLFFDEIDALGASRSDMKQSGNRHLINQFLQELDGIESDNEGVLILGATNTPWNLDTAFRRPGRFDRIIFVPPPDAQAREEIFKLKLQNKPIEAIAYESLAKKTKDYSGADIEAVIDIAIEEKLSGAFSDGIPKPLTTKDLLKATKSHRPSTKEWFSSAKNFALYANDAGLYDDILNYLNIKK